VKGTVRWDRVKGSPLACPCNRTAL
jgi:hypothetical protein